MKLKIRIAALIVLLPIGVFLWHKLFPGDDVLIRRRLETLAQAASFPSDESPLAKIGNAAQLANCFTSDGEVDVSPWGYQRVVVKGRDELRQAALGARSAVASLTVGFESVEVTLGPGRDDAAVSLSVFGQTSQQMERQSQALRLELRKVGGDWFIRRATTVEYLKP